MSSLEPLEVAKETALRHLSMLMLGIFLPGASLLFASNWQNMIDEPLRLPVYVLIPSIGLLVRPSPSRPLQLRGDLAVSALAFTAILALVKAGPRHPNVLGLIGMTFSIAALFGGVRWLTRLTLLFVGAGVLGLLLRSTGIVAPPVYPPPTVLDGLIRLSLGMAMCVFMGRILYGTVSIYRNAYERAQEASEKLLDVERAAQRLQRQELAATMARGMAHDLANFIQVMTASVELMHLSDDREVRRRVAGDTAAIALKATRTLRALLTVGKVSAAKDGRTDIGDMFGRLTTLVAPVVGSRITVNITCHASGGVAMSAEQLEQVLLNLAFNARDAMPDGGALSVIADADTLDGPGSAPAVRITVTDTGVGIPEELQARIFDPYVTTKDTGEGTGLGLAIVARAVDDAGGRIEVWSTAGRGTTFVLRLPVA